MRCKLFVVACTVVISAVLGYGQSVGPQRQAVGGAVAQASSAAAGRVLLDQYCVTCHNDRTKRANLSLEKLDLGTHLLSLIHI